MKKIPGYENYFASEDGHIYSNLRGKLKQLKPWLAAGRMNVALGRDNKHRVHSLVALAFLGERPEGYVVRHLDGNSNNNSASNLCYGTISQNQKDDIFHGVTRGRPLTLENIRDIKQMLEDGERQVDIAKKFGVHSETIGRIKRGRHYSYV